MQKIGIIAGSGDLPYVLIKSLKEQNYEPYVVALGYGITSFLALHKINYKKLAITEVGKAIKYFNSYNIKHIVFIGKIERPNLFSLKPDSESRKLLTKILTNLGGDDRLLSQIIDFFEQDHGFTIIGAQQFISHYTINSHINDNTTDKEKEDIRIGHEYLNLNSKFDIGQAVVVRDRQIIAVEAIEGTGEMLKRVRKYNKNYEYGGVLVKTPKVNQNMKIDLPTIGLATLKMCYKSGIYTIAVGKNNCFIAEKTDVLKYIHKNNINLLAI